MAADPRELGTGVALEQANQSEYGTLTLPQLRAYLAMEQQFLPLVEELYRDIRTDPALLARFSDDLLPWYGMYDLTMEQQLALFMQAFGLTPHIVAAGRADDPHAAMVSLAQKDIPEDWLATDEANATVIKLFGIAIGIANTLDSLRVFGKYINELVAEGRAGNDKSYFDAIRIDPTVICSESFARRLSVAFLKDDRKFIDRLQLALSGKTEKHTSQLNRVRIAMRFLVDAKADGMPDDQLYRLFVDQLNLYSPGEDGAKALRKHLRKQNPSTTQKRKK